jgi:predicted P-loop ATPase
LAHVGDGLGLSFDEFAQAPLLRTEKLPWQVDVGREINDDVIRLIRHYLLSAYGLESGKDHIVEAVLTLARENPFHPVREYLAGLAWDGVPRLDSLLVRYAGAQDSEYIRAIGAKTLLAAVRRVRKPGIKFDYVVVLEGPQGSLKSSFVRELVPKVEWYSDPALGNADSKDAALLLQGSWIIELGEMSVLSKSDIEALKAFVSRGVDRLRRPYERLPISLPRQCIFIGTTNQSEYLMDQTGNRRFWPVRIGAIDIEQLVADREQLWAEAASREAAGESIELPKALWNVAAEHQKERVSEDPWAGLLRDYLDGSTPVGGIGPIDAINRVHTRDLIANALNLNAAQQTPNVPRRLRTVMEKQVGWIYATNVRIGDKQGAGYTRPSET